MFADLFEHETLPGGAAARQKLNAILDAIPASVPVAEIEREFTRRAVAAGFSAEVAEQFMIGGDA